MQSNESWADSTQHGQTKCNRNKDKVLSGLRHNCDSFKLMVAHANGLKVLKAVLQLDVLTRVSSCMSNA